MQTKNTQKDHATVAGHYTSISSHYDDWYSQGWAISAEKQGDALQKLIEAEGLKIPLRALDLACGIGTQSYGLARHGHKVTGLDISPGQLAEAERRTADKTGLKLDWQLGNAETPSTTVTGPFDLIFSFGNSFPLLGSRYAVLNGLKEAYNLLSDGGQVWISMRDHAGLRQTKPYVTASGAFKNGEREGVWLETAEWLDDGMHYKSHIIFVLTAPKAERIHYPFPPLVALTKDEMLDLMAEAGFKNTAFWPQEQNPAFSFPIFRGVKAQ